MSVQSRDHYRAFQWNIETETPWVIIAIDNSESLFSNPDILMKVQKSVKKILDKHKAVGISLFNTSPDWNEVKTDEDLENTIVQLHLHREPTKTERWTLLFNKIASVYSWQTKHIKVYILSDGKTTNKALDEPIQILNGSHIKGKVSLKFVI